MVREMSEVLKQLGWADGFKIPMANDENKELERQVEELVKKKAEVLIQLEIMNEQSTLMDKHLKNMDKEKYLNQNYLNGLRKQLDNEIHTLKDTEHLHNISANQMKEMKKEMLSLDEHINRWSEDIDNYNKKLNVLKESLKWGEDALFAWEEDFARGDMEMDMLKTYKLQDEDRFKSLDLEREKVQKELNEMNYLEKREAERYQILVLQLENICKLLRETNQERERIMKAWNDAFNVVHERENDIKKHLDILSDLKNKARTKCIELYEKKKFCEELDFMNKEMRKEIFDLSQQFSTCKHDSENLAKTLKSIEAEALVLKRKVANTSNAIESQRAKNIEMGESIKARKRKCSKLIDENAKLTETLSTLNVEAMTAEQKCKNAEDIYEMSCKALAEEGKDIQRMTKLIFNLKQELNNVNKKEDLLAGELTLLNQHHTEVTDKMNSLEQDILDFETTAYDLIFEEGFLNAKIVELEGRISQKEENERLEKEIKCLEGEEDKRKKENKSVQQEVILLKKEYSNAIALLRKGKEEIENIHEKFKEKKLALEGEKKALIGAQEELNEARLQLNLLKMSASYTKDNIARDDETVNKLERHRIILEAAMKERKLEIDAQKEILVTQKRTLLEEKGILRKTAENLLLKIKRTKTKFELALDALGKNETGEELSVAHYKIKLAQEKHELMEEGDDLEAKINKTEQEILALENTLHLMGSANYNYKASMQALDPNDPEAAEQLRIDKKLYEVQKITLEDTDFMKIVRNEIEGFEKEIEKLRKSGETLEQEWKMKEKEIISLGQDLEAKQEKLERATRLLIRCYTDVSKCREPPGYKKLAQRDINVRIQEERNKSVLQQLSEIVTNYVETKPNIKRYLGEAGLELPSKRQMASLYLPSHSLSSISSRLGSSRISVRSDLSQPSVVTMDASELL